MTKRVVTFGEIMLRLAPNGYYRFFQNDQLQATFGANLMDGPKVLRGLSMPQAP